MGQERNSKRVAPYLAQLYERYLDDQDAARLISRASRRYSIATIERLAESGPRHLRRAAALLLGFVADYRSNAVIGRQLRDEDRGVRLLAENSIRDIWCRDGTVTQQQLLMRIVHLNTSGQLSAAVHWASELIEQAPWFAEAWNQRAVAHYQRGDYRAAANDCQQTLELNPYHFAAAVGMGNCYLELNDAYAALGCFRRALTLNPGLERVRAQVDYLERALEEK